MVEQLKNKHGKLLRLLAIYVYLFLALIFLGVLIFTAITYSMKGDESMVVRCLKHHKTEIYKTTESGTYCKVANYHWQKLKETQR